MTNGRNSILCPNCRRLVSRDVDRCPYCGIARPGAWWKNTVLTRGLLDGEQLVRTIIAVNIGMFVLSLAFRPGGPGISPSPFALLSPGSESLFLLGATGTIPIDQYGRLWTLFAANYLHAGILHIFFNMMAFSQLGPLVASEYGSSRMIVIYTLGGAGGYLVSYLAGVPFTIGASAAVCGLIGAILYYAKSRGGVYGSQLYRQVGAWTVGLFLFGFLVGGINNWAHGGGIAVGAALGYLMGYRERREETLLHKMLAGACVLLTLLALAWGVGSALFYRLT
ncbi:MAG: rhomboid family intramembrane serine protease [Desulfobacteraceae bacterium]|nr:rhomboid family intramembrane serine protease [Desulfobacteraceae bacterium]